MSATLPEYLRLAPGQRYVFNDETQESHAIDNRSSVLVNHVCFRVSSPERSIAFYNAVLGYSPLFAWNIGPQTVIFLTRLKPDESREDVFKTMQSKEGLLELIWDRSEDKKTGHKEDASFFHIGITVTDVQDILDRAEKFGAPIHKKLGIPTTMLELGCPVDTKMFVPGCEKIFSKVAFIADPDGNWIELVPRNMVSSSSDRSVGWIL